MNLQLISNKPLDHHKEDKILPNHTVKSDPLAINALLSATKPMLEYLSPSALKNNSVTINRY